VALKISVFWDIMPCSQMKVNPPFGRTHHLHFQGGRVSQVRNQYEVSRTVKSAVGREMCRVAEKPFMRVGGMPQGIRWSRIADGKFAAYFMVLSCLTYTSNLKMNICYSEM
jgi:hypothetical protein